MNFVPFTPAPPSPTPPPTGSPYDPDIRYPIRVRPDSPLHPDYPFRPHDAPPIFWQVLVRILGLMALTYLCFIALFWSWHLAVFTQDYQIHPQAYAQALRYLDPTAFPPQAPQTARAVAYLSTYWDWNQLWDSQNGPLGPGVLVLELFQAVTWLAFIYAVGVLPACYLLFLFCVPATFFAAGTDYATQFGQSLFIPLSNETPTWYYGISSMPAYPVGAGLSYQEYVWRRRNYLASLRFPLLLPLPLFVLESLFDFMADRAVAP